MVDEDVGLLALRGPRCCGFLPRRRRPRTRRPPSRRGCRTGSRRRTRRPPAQRRAGRVPRGSGLDRACGAPCPRRRSTTSKFASRLRQARRMPSRIDAWPFALTTPSRRPSARRRGSTSTTSQNASSSSCSGSLCARYAATSSSTRSGARACIWAIEAGTSHGGGQHLIRDVAAEHLLRGVAHGRKDHRPGVDERAVEVEQDDGKAHSLIVVSRSVLDADEVEAPGRRRLPCLRPHATV